MKAMALLFLTDKNLRPNAFGAVYIAWYFSLKGPTFALYEHGA